MTSTQAGPLACTRVLDLTTMISAPIATRMRADQGADVIEVEAPGSGDLKRPGGREALQRPALGALRHAGALA